MSFIHAFYGRIDSMIGDIQPAENKMRKESLAGRILLKKGLDALYGLSLPEGFEGILELEKMITKGKNGKLYLEKYPGIYFNISHSGEYAVCVLADMEVGVDIQMKKPLKNDRLLRRTMDEKQQEAVKNAVDSAMKFADFWAQKESYLKWTGEGITVNLAGLSMEDACMEKLEIREDYAGWVCAGEPFKLKTIHL